MKKTQIITTLLIISLIFLSGCMTTGPIVDNLDHYQKGDTYESIREKNDEEIVDEENIEENIEENVEKDIDEEEIESIEKTEDTGEDIEVKE